MTIADKKEFKVLIKEGTIEALKSSEGQDAIAEALTTEKGQDAIAEALTTEKGQDAIAEALTTPKAQDAIAEALRTDKAKDAILDVFTEAFNDVVLPSFERHHDKIDNLRSRVERLEKERITA